MFRKALQVIVGLFVAPKMLLQTRIYTFSAARKHLFEINGTHSLYVYNTCILINNKTPAGYLYKMLD